MVLRLVECPAEVWPVSYHHRPAGDNEGLSERWRIMAILARAIWQGIGPAPRYPAAAQRRPLHDE